MNRRTVLSAILAGCAAPLAWVRPVKAGSITIPIHADMSEFRKRMADQLKAMKDRDFVPEPQGVLGETYFKVALVRQLPAGKRLHLDGVDVTNRTNEADCVGGWVRMLDVDAKGKVVGGTRTYYGRVELR